jgi:glycosyltransferase 2 family protein
VNAASPPERSWRSPRSLAWLALGFILSAIIIVLIARAIDPDQLALALRGVDWAWVGAALVLTLVTYLSRTQRWIILLRPLAFRTSTVLRALLTGQLLNHLLPLRVGDVVRAILLGREPGGSFARVFGSVLIEKAWDWLALCVLMLIVTWAVPLPDWLLAPARSIGLVAALVLLGFVVVAVIPARWIPLALSKLDRALAGLPAQWRSFVLRNAQRLLDSLAVLRQSDTITGAAIWTAITWGLSIIINYAVQRACGIDSWLAATTLLVVLMLGVALPPSIAALGIFEGLSMLTLSLYNVPLETALAIGLLLHLVVIVPLLICTALTWLFRSH